MKLCESVLEKAKGVVEKLREKLNVCLTIFAEK